MGHSWDSLCSLLAPAAGALPTLCRTLTKPECNLTLAQISLDLSSLASIGVLNGTPTLFIACRLVVVYEEKVREEVREEVENSSYLTMSLRRLPMLAPWSMASSTRNLASVPLGSTRQRFMMPRYSPMKDADLHKKPSMRAGLA